MTRRELFQKLAFRSATLQFPSGTPNTDGGMDCFYRGPYGRKCAVGMLITDEQYRPTMETLTVRSLTIAFPDVRLDLDTDELSDTLLDTLQYIHDSVASISRRRGLTWDHESFMTRMREKFYDFPRRGDPVWKL